MDETHNGSTGSSGHNPAVDTTAGSGPADETFGWTAADDDAPAAGGDARATAERMLGQLQSMIDNLATQAAPVARQIGAKAAELAAVAADRAGPLAQKAAEATADASVRIAEKSRTWAADLRGKDADFGPTGDAESDSRASAAMGGADDAAELDDADAPAEGERA